MSIQAIIFDADGVLVHAWRFAAYLEREHGLTGEVTREFFSGPFQQCLVGRADMADVLPAYLDRWGWAGGYTEFVSVWLNIENAVDGRVLKTVQALRRLGYVCALATNQEQHRGRYMITEMGFGSEFDHLFFSHEIGATKPDKKFYAAVEKTLGLAGPEILFWDDSLSHVEAARQRGWHAELYTDYESFAQSLLAYVVPNAETDAFVDILDFEDSVAGLRAGFADLEAGRTVSLEELKAELAARRKAREAVGSVMTVE